MSWNWQVEYNEHVNAARAAFKVAYNGSSQTASWYAQIASAHIAMARELREQAEHPEMIPQEERGTSE